MDAVTYPQADVQQLIKEHFVPVQFNIKEQPQVMDRFHSSWTPTLIVQDPEGVEHRRCQGYLDPSRFRGEMGLAWLKDAIDRREWPAARERSKEALSLSRGDLFREPEVMYWSAVAAYKSSEDATGLLAGWNQLIDRFPDSEWAKRAEFIRQPRS